MRSYICHTCNTEHDTVPQALACARSHGPQTPQAPEPPSPDLDPGVGDVPEEVTRPPEPSMPLALAPELLGRAARHMHDRASTYDKPEGERSMGRAVAAFNAITGHTLNESEGWLLLQVLKDVRLFTRETYHADSAEDGIAYAALKAEARSKGL